MVGLKNLGAAPIALAGVTSDSEDFVVDRTALKADLAPDETTTFTVTFVPGAAGTRSGYASVYRDGVAAPVATIPLMGNAVRAPVRGVTGGCVVDDTAAAPSLARYFAGAASSRRISRTSSAASDVFWM